MTLRQQIVSSATGTLVRSVREYGEPRRGMADKAWEIVEGLRSRNSAVETYVASISDDSADQMCGKIAKQARARLGKG